MDKCQFCIKDDGNYLLSNACCATRYLLTQTLDSRREYLLRWQKKHGAAATEALKVEFARAWSERAAALQIFTKN